MKSTESRRLSAADGERIKASLVAAASLGVSDLHGAALALIEAFLEVDEAMGATSPPALPAPGAAAPSSPERLRC